jgi:hypothetical protein
MNKKKSKHKPATPTAERDDYDAVRTFMKRANRDAKRMAEYLANWCRTDEAAGLVRKSK